MFVEKLTLLDGEELVLASASPRRAELLRNAGIRIVQKPTDIDEDAITADAPDKLVRLIAEAKNEACTDCGLILSSDTVVALDKRIFGKPANIAEAREFLKALSGKQHFVYTGVCIRRGNVKLSWTAASAVLFKTLDDSLINEYFSLVNPLDKAGAYAIQQHGDMIVESYHGLLSTIIGLPIEEVLDVINPAH